MVVSKKKSAPKHLTAKLLVLGDKQVGKSASIVRYTTGRYIQEYSNATNDWLYQHSLGYESKQNAHLSVELLEQKDIHFSSSSNFFAPSKHLSTNNSNLDNTSQKSTAASSSHQTLASRVALDQQIDNEYREKQRLLSKLHWANAYVVIYAINDVSTFNKAIKYLNLIANHINSPSHDSSTSNKQSSTSTTNHHHHHHHHNNSNNPIASNTYCATGRGSTGGSYSSTGSASSTSSTGSVSSNSSFNSNNNLGYKNGSGGSCSSINSNKFITACANKLSPSSNAHNTCTCSGPNKRPILLLANKQDLKELSRARQVSSRDGRLLAMRHQSIFAEVSVANSHRSIQSALATLIEQIDPTCLRVDSPELQVNHRYEAAAARISQWRPSIELALTQSSMSLTAPVWGSLIKSQVVSSTVVQSSCIAPVSRLEPADVRLITPLNKSSSAESGRLLSSCRPAALTPQTVDILSKRCQVVGPVSKPKPAVAQRLTSSNRYENLKTSFKRASMAINAVTHSSKALKSRSNTSKLVTTTNSAETPVNHQQQQQPQCSTTGRFSEPIIERAPAPSSPATAEQLKARKVSTVSASNAPTSWIRSHIKLTRDRNAAASASDPKLHSFQETTSGAADEEKVGRTLFKYKNRRKTVAFDRIKNATNATTSTIGSSAGGGSVTGSIVEVGAELSRLPDTTTSLTGSSARAGSLTANGRTGGGSTGSDQVAYSSTRNSSSRSSSSLSTSTDAYYSALLMSWRSLNGDQAPSSVGSTCSSGTFTSTSQTAGNPTSRTNGITTCAAETARSSTSRASFSGVSRAADFSGDDQAFSATLTPVITSVATSSPVHQPEVNGAKKRYHLVKTMQSTLTNLTRSSNVSAQAAKKSFCNVLFRQTNNSGAVPSTASSDIPAPVLRSTIAPAPIVSLPKTEQILAMPLVGYCQ